MKIYTEIIYTWDDNKGELVEESSKFYDYEGEVTLCWGGSFWQAVSTVTGGAITGEGAETTLTDASDAATAAADKLAADLAAERKRIKDLADAAAAQAAIYAQDAIDQAQTTIETTIDQNTDSLNDLEQGINTSVSDAVDMAETGVENLAIIGGGIEDTFNLLGEGVSYALDATININNPDSLISSPTNWYENVAGVGKGGWSLDWLEEAQSDALDKMVGGALGWILGGADNPWNQGGTEDSSAATGSGSSLGPGFTSFEGLRGDPFGRTGKERREIHQQRKFPQQVASAPSLINQKQKLLLG